MAVFAAILQPVPDLPHGPSLHLLRRAASRDEQAARELVETHGPLVRKIIHSHAALKPEADDLMQDVFFKVFHTGGAYRGEAPLEHWIARVARFTCIDRLRHLKARPELRFSDLTPAQQETFSTGIPAQPAATAGEDARDLLEKIFALLAPLDAWLLREMELHERTAADVAAEAGWSIPLTHVRLFRARRRLKAAFHSFDSRIP